MLSLDAMVLSSPPGESPICRLSAQRRLAQGACPRPMEAQRRARNVAGTGLATLLLLGEPELERVVDAGHNEPAHALLLRLAAASMPLSVMPRRGAPQLHDAKYVSVRLAPNGIAHIGLQRRRAGAASTDAVPMLAVDGRTVRVAPFMHLDRSDRSRAGVRARGAAARAARGQAERGYMPLAHLRGVTAQVLAPQRRYVQMAEAFAYEAALQGAQSGDGGGTPRGDDAADAARDNAGQEDGGGDAGDAAGTATNADRRDIAMHQMKVLFAS